MDQPTNTPTAKVTAAGAAGALSVLVVFVLGQLGVDVGPEGAAAIATVAAFLAGYLKREAPTGTTYQGERGLTMLEVLVLLLIAAVAGLALVVLT